jgi:hypothetical protein
MATIDCGTQKPLNQYTIVHELGHVFQHRTTEIINPSNPQAHPCYNANATSHSINFCMEIPVPSASGSLGTGDTYFIFGKRTFYYTRNQVATLLQRLGIPTTVLTAEAFTYAAYIANDPTLYYEANSEWYRGIRGWGSPTGQQVGPCDGDAPSNFVPTDFQQNPCEFYPWIEAALRGISPQDPSLIPLGVVEHEEALGDMFVNWVYRTLTNGQSGQVGFGNLDGKGLPDSNVITNLATLVPGSFPQQRNGPGDDRFYWMNSVVIRFFNYYGF